MRDYFITYNHSDESWAVWIATTLESAGHTTYSQALDFQAGGNFMLAMEKGLTEARHTIGVLSARYLASAFAAAEWTAAYRDAIVGKARGFIPVMVEKCALPSLLGPIAYVDLVGLHEAQARTRLLEGVAATRPRPTAPPFPGPPFPGP